MDREAYRGYVKAIRQLIPDSQPLSEGAELFIRRMWSAGVHFTVLGSDCITAQSVIEELERPDDHHP